MLIGGVNAHHVTLDVVLDDLDLVELDSREDFVSLHRLHLLLVLFFLLYTHNWRLHPNQ